MAESIGQRVARLVSGSVNALVDAVEGQVPEAVMEQALRELDSAIDEARSELGKFIAQKHLASKKLMEENSRHETLSEQLEAAISSGRDDLAEVGIAQQIDIESRIPVLEASIAECSSKEKELEGFIQALQAKKRDMKADLHQFRQARQQAGSMNAAAQSGGSGAQQKAESATASFERVLEKQSGIEGRSTTTDTAIKLAELEELTRKNRISERLAALKADKN